MRAYVIVTGALFALLPLVHVWRAIDAEPHLARDPSFVLITIATGALCLWALYLLRRPARL